MEVKKSCWIDATINEQGKLVSWSRFPNTFKVATGIFSGVILFSTIELVAKNDVVGGLFIGVGILGILATILISIKRFQSIKRNEKILSLEEGRLNAINQTLEPENPISNPANETILPLDVIDHVFSFLDKQSLMNASLVSKNFYLVGNQSSQWKELAISLYGLERWTSLSDNDSPQSAKEKFLSLKGKEIEIRVEEKRKNLLSNFFFIRKEQAAEQLTFQELPSGD